MAQDGLKTYEETLKRYRDQQARLNSLAEGSELTLADIKAMAKEDNEIGNVAADIKKLSDNEHTEFTLADPSTKDAKDVIRQYLEGKILPQKKQEVKDNSNGVSLDEYRKRRANELEQTNPELLKKIQEVNPAYKPISNEIRNFNVSDYLNNSMDLAMGKNPDNNIQIPFKPMLSDIANTTQSAPQQVVQQDSKQKSQQSDKVNLNTNINVPVKNLKGNDTQLDPLAQYQQLLKMQEEKDLASKNELAQAQKERDFASALGMISSGLSKAAAGYGGGSVTELKGDTTAEQALVGQADQKIADIKERMKSATDNEKKILERQLTLAQLQKMRDDKRLDEERMGIEKAKLGLEKQKLESDLKKKQEGLVLTKGEESRDRNFSKDYIDWNTTGKATFDKNIKRLEDAKNELEKVKKDWIGTSGRVTGRLPEFLRSEKSLQLQQDVQSAAQMGLRQTLGAQFTEKEGERIMAFSYDPTLSPEANIKKIDATINELKAGAKSKDDMSRHFEESGTLKGYQPEQQATISSTGPYGAEVERNGKKYIWNPSVNKYQLK